MMLPPAVKLPLVVFAALLVQLSVVNRIELWGVSGDVLVVVAIAGGFVAGPERGAAIGFAAGLAIDLLLSTPLGLTALVFTVVGYVAGIVSVNLIRSSRLTLFALVALSAPAAVGAWVVIGALFGQTHLLDAPVATIALVVTIVALIVTPLVTPALHWAATNPDHRAMRR
jgi:rod shape-determining protein MreD